DLFMADSHTGNHHEDDFTPLETIRRSNSIIGKKILFELEGEAFELGRREPSLSFSIGSPSVSINIEPLRADEEPILQPAEVTTDYGGSPKPELFVVHPGSVAARIKDRKCKARGGSSKPHVKRKLASGSSNSRATRAKTSTSKDDVPFLTVSHDDEGLSDVLELKDATACHLKISAITLLAWKNHLDNHMDVKLLDLHDRYYARQAVIDNAMNRRSRELLEVIEKLREECDVIKERERAREEESESLRLKCEVAMSDFEKNPTVITLREKISTLSTEVKEHKANLNRMMLESQKWESYQASLLTLESQISSLEAEKGYLEVGMLVQRLLTPSYKKEHNQFGNDLATTTFPWLSEFVADPSAPVEVLLSKKPSSLQRPAPSKTQDLVASSLKATPSSILGVPKTDLFVVQHGRGKLASGSFVLSCYSSAKNSIRTKMKDDVPFLIVSDNDKGREPGKKEVCRVSELKCEVAMSDFEKNPTVIALREKISTLSTEVKEHKIASLEAEKARLEAVEVSLQKEVNDVKRDRKWWLSTKKWISTQKRHKKNQAKMIKTEHGHGKDVQNQGQCPKNASQSQ
ncbi:hypothetical protein Tco_1069964, partial [Tanacetum coccineum]